MPWKPSGVGVVCVCVGGGGYFKKKGGGCLAGSVQERDS